MADYTVNIDLDYHKRGDRWNGIPIIGPILVNGVTPTGALTGIRMQFKNNKGSVFRLHSDTGQLPDAPISIDSGDTWVASVPEVENFVPVAGDWDWDMEFYESGKAGPLTFYKGILTVLEDVTR
jgi:hypothetical protein